GGAGGGADAAAPPSAEDTPGPARFRRLTKLELTNSVRDLLGETRGLPLTSRLSGDEGGAEDGFARGAPVITGEDAWQLMSFAQDVSRVAMGRLSTLLPCPHPATRAE